MDSKVATNPLLARLPRFRRGAFSIFLLTAICSALLADQPIARDLVLLPDRVMAGETLWAPFTALVVFPDASVGLVLGTLFIQWFLGGHLEDFWGTKKYLAFVIGCALFGHAVSIGLGALVDEVGSTPLGGATAMDLAAVSAFGVVFGKRPLSLAGVVPLSSRGLAALIAALAVVSPLVRGAPWPVVLPWLAAILAALAVTTQPWRRLRSSGKLGGRKNGRRSHLKVVRPDRNLLN
jgi:membrane associated rhomboid family serine protease